MPLLLLDLDNTLIDRTAAYRRWAAAFTGAAGLPAAETQWLIDADRDGHEPRESLAARMRERFGLAGQDEGQDEVGLVAELRRGIIENLELDPAVPRALDTARAAGWTPVVVTNGAVAHQERKLRRTGLDHHVAHWIISEGAGVSKPDPRIFRLAAEQAGEPLDGAWMIGDTAEADIAGARNAGLPSIWLRRGREWTAADYAPTRVADRCVQAIAIVTSTAAG